MPTGRNVSQEKKCMKIVQDLPWNTEDLKSGREQADATSPCLAYLERCAKSWSFLKIGKWLHNPGTDCQDALPAFAWNCHSLLWSLPCSEAAVSGHTSARTHTLTPPLLPTARSRRSPQAPAPGPPVLPAAAAVYGNALRDIIQKHTSPRRNHRSNCRMSPFYPPVQSHTSVNFSWELCAKWVQVF